MQSYIEGSKFWKNLELLEAEAEKAVLLGELSHITLSTGDWLAWCYWDGTDRKQFPHAGGFLDQPKPIMDKLLQLDRAQKIVQRMIDIDKKDKDILDQAKKIKQRKEQELAQNEQFA